jgi:enamine deaminase RidA (YjgF/YER057c/UK114 family)
MLYKFLWVGCFLCLALFTRAQQAEAKLTELNIQLPAVGKPIANYVKWVRTGNLIFLSGHGPQKPDGSYITGKLGKDLSIEQGYEAARLTAIQLLASLKDAVGDLNKVKSVVKVLGMVNSVPEFSDQPKVINGCSDLLVAVFGEKGRHARSAVGMNALPAGNMCVEIEMIVEAE